MTLLIFYFGSKSINSYEMWKWFMTSSVDSNNVEVSVLSLCLVLILFEVFYKSYMCKHT